MKNPNKLPAVPLSAAKLLLDVGFVRILLVLLTPFRGILAWNLFCGRSVWNLAIALERTLLAWAGWLSAPPKTKALRHLFLSLVTVKRWHIVAAVAVLYSTIQAALRTWRDSKDERVQQRQYLLSKMASSLSYDEWSVYAQKLDAMDGVDENARWNAEARLYDRRLLEEKLNHLRSVRAADAGVHERMFAVRADLLRNLGNISSAALHEQFAVVPNLIREYVQEVRTHLEDISFAPELPLADKASFLRETRHAFGRTALLLSGGGALASFHLGVVKALQQHQLLPRILGGSAVGGVVAALAGTRTDAELAETLADLSRCDLSMFSTAASAGGRAMDLAVQLRRLRHLLGDFTFLEAYKHTGRVLNLSVAASGTAEPPRLLNYLTSPHVMVWSAVACSSALHDKCKPLDLLARSSTGALVGFAASDAPGPVTGWHDGSLEGNLPMRGLSEMFGVNHFIVSQTTPHIVPFLTLKRRLGTVGHLAEAEVKHRCRQALELLPRLRYGWPARWLRAFSQPWEGDVTIALPDAAAQLAKAVLGPSRVDLLHAVKLGEVTAWSKLSAIQSNCGIEATLDGCIRQVAKWEGQEAHKRRAAAAQPLAEAARLHGRGGVPSSPFLLQSLEQKQQRDSSSGSNEDTASYCTPAGSLTSARLPLQAASGGGRDRYVPEAAYECIDASANPFPPGSPSPLAMGLPSSLVTRRDIPGILRKSLDWIAP